METTHAREARSLRERPPRRQLARRTGNAVVCPEHHRLLARVTADGLELWCRCGHGHTVLLPFTELQSEAAQKEEGAV